MKSSVCLVALLALLGCESSRRAEKDTTRTSPSTSPVEADAMKATSVGAPNAVPKQRAAMYPLEIHWTLEPAAKGDELVLAYTVKNVGKDPVYLVDQLVNMDRRGLVVIGDRVVVQQGTDPDTVRFVAGHVGPGPGQAVAWEAAPPARLLAPDATLEGTKRIPLPLKAWHPYMTMPALAKVPTRAEFQVTWLPDTPPGRQPMWQNMPASAGGTIRTPSEVFVSLSLRRATTEPVKLP